MGVLKTTLREGSALIVIAFVLGFVGNELRGPARIDPFRNYFATREADSRERYSSEADAPGETKLQHDYQEIGFDAVADLFFDASTEAGANIFVDARSDKAYEEGHIPGAGQCDHFKLERDIPNVLDHVDAAEKIIVYSNGGECEDSIFVCGDLMEFDIPYERIFLFSGGWKEWTDNSMAVEGGRVN